MEALTPLRGTDAWHALRKADNLDSTDSDSCPLSPDLLSDTSPCRKPPNSTVTSERDRSGVLDLTGQRARERRCQKGYRIIEGSIKAKP